MDREGGRLGGRPLSERFSSPILVELPLPTGDRDRAGAFRANFGRAIEHGNPMTWRMPPVRTAAGAGLAEEVGADRRAPERM